MKACPEAEGGLSLFQMARLRIQGYLPDLSSLYIILFVFLEHLDVPRRMAVNICGGHSIPPSSDQVSHMIYTCPTVFLMVQVVVAVLAYIS